MAGLALYTDDYTPQRVGATETADDRDTTLVETAVRAGDRPLDLLVEFDAAGDRIIWSFTGKQESDASRVDSFLADFIAPPEADSFAAFAEALRSLHGEVLIPPADGLQGDLGFQAWRVAPATPGLDDADWQRLCDRLATDGSDQSARPLVVGMASYRSALAVVRALQAADVACRVGVGTDCEADRLTDIDLLLVPDGATEFEPRSERAAAWLASSSRAAPSSAADRAPDDTEPASGSTQARATDHGLAPRIGAIAIALGYLSGVVVLYRGNANLTYLLVGNVLGLVATGGLLGADRLASDRPWVAGGVLAVLGVAGLASGSLAVLHAAGIERNGLVATVTAGGYLGFILCFGLYAAGTAMRRGAGAVVPAARSLLPGA